MSSLCVVRDAVADDLPAITDLYNSLIPTTTVAWTELRQTVAERSAWFDRQNADRFPVLVADVDGRVVGFCAYGHFRGAGKWPGYAFTAEHTIHVAQEQWANGIGRVLLETLVVRAQDNGIHVLVGAIDGDNGASIRFHQRLGFAEVARMPQVGHKFGRWLDLVLMQRVLDDRANP